MALITRVRLSAVIAALVIGGASSEISSSSGGRKHGIRVAESIFRTLLTAQVPPPDADADSNALTPSNFTVADEPKPPVAPSDESPAAEALVDPGSQGARLNAVDLGTALAPTTKPITPGGMTSGQKSMLISASLFLAFHIDYSSQFLGNLAAQKKWTEFEKMAKAGANGVAAIGPLIALAALFVDTGDAEVQFLTEQFNAVDQRLEAVSRLVKTLPDLMDSTNSIQVYAEQQTNLYTVKAELQNWMKAKTSGNFTTARKTFETQCSINSPIAFLDFLQTQLTANGDCGFPTQCLLDPKAGVAAKVAYSRPGFLDFIKIFVQDTVIAAELSNYCFSLGGPSQEDLDVNMKRLQAQYVHVLDNLGQYYDGVMTTAFWQYQFQKDIDGVMHTNVADNQAIANSLHDALAAKYDFLQWVPVVWSGATGGDHQGTITYGCSGDIVSEQCSKTGGLFKRFRLPLDSGDTVSVALFFSPANERPAPREISDALDRRIEWCSQITENVSDMVNLASCVNEKDGSTRGVLAVPFGNGLRSNFEDDVNVHFVNHRLECVYDGPYDGCEGQESSIVVLLPQP